MRILYMTQWFEPEPVLKGIGFAKMLRDSGHDIRVVTGFPNYPGGKVYPGYRIRPFRRERMDGVIIDRVPLFPSHNRSAAGRVLNYLSFAISVFAYGLFSAGKADVIYAYHPPLTVALAAVLVGMTRRRPVVVDIQDLWPDSLKATGMVNGARTLKVAEAICRFIYRRAARLTVLSRGMKHTLVARGVEEAKIDVIPNWADEPQTIPMRRFDLSALGFEGRFNIVFAGNLGLAQGLDVVLNAARQTAELEPRVQFVLVGDGIDAPRLRARINAEKLANVRMTGRVSRENVADVLHAADVLLVTLADDPLFEITIPSKTQFYLAMSKPILMSASGDAARIVDEAGAGTSVPPADAEALALAAVTMARTEPLALQAMGMSGQAYYAEHMSMAAGVEKTLAVINKVALSNRHRTVAAPT